MNVSPAEPHPKCLSGANLLAAKRAADRPQDQADIEYLMELQRLGKLA